MSHPYADLPDRAFWRRTVGGDFDASRLVPAGPPLLRPDDVVISAGSCFAANMIPHLEAAGFAYLRTEELPEPFADLPENLGYGDYSARYGNVYTARQLRQLLERSLGLRSPVEDRWYVDDAVVDPYRPGLAYPASSDREFDAATASHLAAVECAFRTASVLVFTLGLTEAWESRLDGTVFPVCPGTVAGTFDETRHRFVNFTPDDVEEDLRAFLARLREVNSGIRSILTVSPVPLVATYSGQDVVSATVYSKSVLRVAAEVVTRTQPDVRYFPAYEMVTGPQASVEAFEDDRRSVTAECVRGVMVAFLAACAPAGGREESRPTVASAVEVSRSLSAAECDEALLDA